MCGHRSRSLPRLGPTGCDARVSCDRANSNRDAVGYCRTSRRPRMSALFYCSRLAEGDTDMRINTSGRQEAGAGTRKSLSAARPPRRIKEQCLRKSPNIRRSHPGSTGNVQPSRPWITRRSPFSQARLEGGGIVERGSCAVGNIRRKLGMRRLSRCRWTARPAVYKSERTLHSGTFSALARSPISADSCDTKRFTQRQKYIQNALQSSL